MFCKLIKLSNGENIIATTDSSCLNFKNLDTIAVVDPVLITNIKISQGSYFIETYTMQPWLKLARKDVIDIPTENIIVAVDVEDSVKVQYEKYLDEYQKETPIPYDGDILLDMNDEEDYFEEDDLDESENPTFH